MKRYLFNFLLKKFQDLYINGSVSDKEIENAVYDAIKTPSKIMVTKKNDVYFDTYRWLLVVMICLFVPPCVTLIYMNIWGEIDAQKLIISAAVMVVSLISIIIISRELGKEEQMFAEVREYLELRAIRHLQTNNTTISSVQKEKK